MKPTPEEQELSAALAAAHDDMRQLRSTFGQGEYQGKMSLKNHFPAWFQAWMKDADWYSGCIISGESDWWAFVNAMGYSQERWWASTERYRES